MTGLDSNVLVRYFFKDDPLQTPIAVTLIHSLSPADPGWVGLVVLAELIWVLKRIYKVGRTGIIDVVEILLASQEIVLEQEDLVGRAFSLYRNGKADFGDCLISISARNAGCDRIATFEKRSARDAGMELIG